ncbi:superfamily II DNA/RNA helicase [Deinobacterium chartae]|uniref:RNA helicase n=1 Tax=Deinobacterium chartae TaxID=521158 RepID=A0A841HZY3_9DEIO|nr:DEAD/DEAH box helicase [Deinobacterium chartae]MBB6098503.1 superfamily II DNA/RNA helicase [Deinobacterium chartae]
MLFSDLNLSPEVVERLSKRGITEPSPIQAESLPYTLEGRDLIGRARTGTGKTLAFALPIIERLEPSRERGRLPRALVLAPTRELAKQVAGEFEAVAPNLEIVTVYGGAPYATQERALSRGVDVVVGTPGRIIDHLQRGNLQLDAVRFAVLDEADEMLNVGFAEAVEEILSRTPSERQTLFFSATLPQGVMRLARSYLQNPQVVDLIGENAAKTAQTVEHIAVKAGKSRTRVLADLLTIYNPERAIVFTRTKREVDELALELIHRGLEAEGLHGDMAQSQRERALASFRSGRTRVLVATDVAARGLDIAEVDVVVQYHLPHDTEAYVHRSGRTGRAGRNGTAIVLYGDREQRALRNLEHATGVHFAKREAPRADEVQAASVTAAANLVRAVDAEVAQTFLSQAEALLAEMGPLALARALAKISGSTEPVRSVSLLSGEEDMTAVLLTAERMTIPRAVALIARTLNIEARSLGKIRLWAGGAVADVPTASLDELLAASPLDGGVPVTVAEEIPELFEPRRDERQGDRGGYGRSDRGGYGRGGYNNRREGGYRDRRDGGYRDRR